eukprot:3538495-Pleurochrysis_carterae.AAC.1
MFCVPFATCRPPACKGHAHKTPCLPARSARRVSPPAARGALLPPAAGHPPILGPPEAVEDPPRCAPRSSWPSPP